MGDRIFHLKILDPHLKWSVIMIAFKRGIKYFRGVQKFQAKVIWGSTFRGVQIYLYSPIFASDGSTHKTFCLETILLSFAK